MANMMARIQHNNFPTMEENNALLELGTPKQKIQQFIEIYNCEHKKAMGNVITTPEST